ncbi:MgtC/SapB family protein [Comamonas guangdongensis]|uniref:MgtC/SapB family protein n=1 Tax=Comamonas guangdongensis TaxID=510515 RepID=A0ABV3ZW11_9BURK
MSDETLHALLTALGMGLMIGLVRERMHGQPQLAAGTRTHALACLLGCVAWMLGAPAFAVGLLLVGGLTIASYRQTASQDPGLTGEVALLLTVLLGALAAVDASLAAALGVLVAILLLAKAPMQKLSRELISESELQDALMLGAAALVVMPLLPTEPLDPWGAVSPTTVWRIVVLVMAVGMFGHVAQRLFGARWGLPLAGFFAGFVSSSAAVTGMGQSARDNRARTAACAAAALLANLASLLLFVAVVGTVSPPLLSAALPALAAAVLALLTVAGFWLWRANQTDMPPAADSGRAFALSQALLIAALIAGVSLLAAWLGQRFGSAGVLVTTTLVALAEVHAAAAGVAQLQISGAVPLELARWGVLAVLGASCLAKTVLAFASGGTRYGAAVATGLIAMPSAAWLGLLLSN